MSTTDDIAARVARGAALLDKKRPGWDREIKLDILDMASPSFCVLGQLFGDYQNSESTSFLPIEHPSNREYYGFTTYGRVKPPWKGIRAAWVREIESRVASRTLIGLDTTYGE